MVSSTARSLKHGLTGSRSSQIKAWPSQLGWQTLPNSNEGDAVEDQDTRRKALPPQPDDDMRIEDLHRRVQEAVQRGLDAASTTQARAQRRLEQAADVFDRNSRPFIRSAIWATIITSGVVLLVEILRARRVEDRARSSNEDE